MPPRSFPTHFLCLPLVTSSSRAQLSSNLTTFAADVTSPDSFGIPSDAVRPVGTLHLTLGVMSFPADENLEKAAGLLRTIIPRDVLARIKSPEAAATPPPPPPPPSEQSLGPQPQPPSLSVTLRGLKSMQAASRATVLYSPPQEDDGTLQRFCETVKAAFIDAGLMVAEGRPLLLHATVVNTIYVKGGRGRGKKHERITIDARGILDRYDDFVFVRDAPVEKIAICRMGAKKLDNGDEAYEVVAEIDI